MCKGNLTRWYNRGIIYVKETCQDFKTVEIINCKWTLLYEEGSYGKQGRETKKGFEHESRRFCQSNSCIKTVSAIETGKYNPSLELAFAISDFFGKSIEEIFIYERGNKDEKE